jgi:hypothetical protein
MFREAEIDEWERRRKMGPRRLANLRLRAQPDHRAFGTRP